MIRRPPPAAGPLAPLAAVALAAAVFTGCATAPPPAPSTTPAPPAEPAAPEPADAPAPVPALTPPWEIPPDRLGMQRLYRVHYEGPKGEGGVRVTLWLDDADHYDARAADQLGRPVWSLSVRGDGGLWVDHRAEAWCRLHGELDLDGLPLAPFPLASLPPLLLGRLPAPPADRTAAAEAAAAADGAIEIRDAEGRRWTAELAGGALVRWTLWGRQAAAGPVLTWLDAGGEAVLSDRAAGVQLRWREAVAEPLAGLPAPIEPPAGYRAATCGAAGG